MTERPAWTRWSIAGWLGLLAGLVAVAWSILILDPLGPATIDPDASTSVLYFDRIVSGHRLEVFVPTTPKPLLTVAFGLTWSLLHDWRALVWETIALWGVAVGATTALAARLAARAVWPRTAMAGARGTAPVSALVAAVAAVAAGTFAAAALLGSSELMLEVSRANSLVWALALWSLAGLAATASPRRPTLAGAMLFLAGLCRFETLALDAAALLLLLLATPGARRNVRPPGALAGVLVAFLAVPVALLHDWLLSGDPGYFLSVPGRYTAIFNPGLAPIDLLSYAAVLAARFAPEWPLVAIAAVGLIALALGRQLVALTGILAIGLGVVALLFWLSARGTYISTRYYEPIELALIASAAVGIGWLGGLLLGRLRALGFPAAATAGAAIGVCLLWPALPWDRRATTELLTVRTASARLAQAIPVLDVVLHDLQPRPTRLLVPSRDMTRVALELPASLDSVGNSYQEMLTGGVAGLRAGEVVFHDDAADRPLALYRPLEIQSTTTIGGIALERLPLDVPGTWLLRVR